MLVILGDSKLTRVRRACKYIERAIDVLQGAVVRRPDQRLTWVSLSFVSGLKLNETVTGKSP